MAAARWTLDARDITRDPDTWGDYLTAQELSDLIDLGENTIMDTLTRRVTDPTDPRIAIYRPAARIGPTRLNSLPRWTRDQAAEYLRLFEQRGTLPRAEDRRELPVYTAAAAKRAGLASTAELAELLGRAENSLRWWARSFRVATDDTPAFPPEVGIAERQPPDQFGPPRGLRKIRDVQRWVDANARPSLAKRKAG